MKAGIFETAWIGLRLASEALPAYQVSKIVIVFGVSRRLDESCVRRMTHRVPRHVRSATAAALKLALAVSATAAPPHHLSSFQLVPIRDWWRLSVSLLSNPGRSFKR